MVRPFRNGFRQRARFSGLCYYLVPLLALALFLDKPFHIDDVTFIRMGEMLPWHVFGDARAAFDFLGVAYESISAFESTHPVLIPYYLKWAGLFQKAGAEPVFWIYHLFFLIFPFLTLYFARRFAERFSISNYWGWLLVFSPAFFVNAGSLMTDTAMTAFWLGSVHFSFGYGETHAKRDALLAALCMTLALLTSYQSVALAPLLLAYFLIKGKPDRGVFAILILPLAALSLYLVGVYLVSGFFPFLASGVELNIASEVRSGMDLGLFLHKAVAILVNLGLGLGVLVPAVIVSSRERFRSGFLLTWASCSLVMIFVALRQKVWLDYPNGERILLAVLMSLGLFWIVTAIFQGARAMARIQDRKRAAWLLLPCFWLLGVIAYNLIFLPYATVRYLMPALPPALMLIFMNRDVVFAINGKMMVSLAVSAGLSLLMARVDYRLAAADFQIYRELKQDIQATSKTLWYSDDAGLTRYLRLIDGRYLTQDDAPVRPGDLVLVTRGLIPPAVMDDLVLIETYEIPAFWGLTLFDTAHRAGFYRSFDGMLPLTRAPLAKRAWLFEVNFFVRNEDRAVALDLANPNYFGKRTFAFPDGRHLGVLFMHPDAMVGYPIEADERYVLRGSMIGNPDAWSKDGDGVTGEIGVRVQGEDRVIWSRYLNGKSVELDREPAAFELTLPKDADLLWFRSKPGPAGDYRYDGMGWLSLSLTVE